MKRRVLLVNMDGSTAQVQSSILGRDGLEVLTAPTLDAAASIHRSERVDLVVADVTSAPGLRRLRSPGFGTDTFQDIPVILLCGSQPEEKALALSLGASAVIEKPLTHDRLHDHVAEFLALTPRRCRRVSVTVEVSASTGRRVFPCIAENLSVSGMLIETEVKLAVGDDVTASFVLSSNVRIFVDCVVVRDVSHAAGVHHYGLRFINLDEEQCDYLETFIEAVGGTA